MFLFAQSRHRQNLRPAHRDHELDGGFGQRARGLCRDEPFRGFESGSGRLGPALGAAADPFLDPALFVRVANRLDHGLELIGLFDEGGEAAGNGEKDAGLVKEVSVRDSGTPRGWSVISADCANTALGSGIPPREPPGLWRRVRMHRSRVTVAMGFPVEYPGAPSLSGGVQDAFSLVREGDGSVRSCDREAASRAGEPRAGNNNEPSASCMKAMEVYGAVAERLPPARVNPERATKTSLQPRA